MRVAPENGEPIMKRSVWIGAAILVLVAGLGVGSIVLEKKAAVQAAGVQAPMFEVDPMWPKPLPNHWVIGMTIGVSVDAQDNVWIIHRGGSLEAKETYGNTNPPGADCCVTAPSVLEFDKAGNLLEHWGGPGKGYNWPNSNHGITVDYKGNVWIGGNGRTVDPKLQDTGASNVPEASQPGAYADNQILMRQSTSSSAIRCTAPNSRTTDYSTSVTGRTIASRYSSRTAPSSRSKSSKKGRWVMGPFGTSLFRRTRDRSTSISPMGRTRRFTSCCATLSRS